MDVALSKEDRAFAERMREFFTSEIPAEIRDRLARGEHPTREDVVTSQRILNAHQLAVPHWPAVHVASGQLNRQVGHIQLFIDRDLTPGAGVAGVGPGVLLPGIEADL